MISPKDDKVVQYINEYYNNENSKLTYKALCEMVEEELDRRDLIVEAKAKKSTIDCTSIIPTTPSMRFEYVVIASARTIGGKQRKPLIAKINKPNAIDAKGKKKTAAKFKKEMDEAKKVAANDTKAYACAAQPSWRDIKLKQGTLGKLADITIKKCLQAGYIDSSDYAAASMAGVSKQAPSWGGPAIEPKTDVKFGSANISIKLAGDVQAASSEAANTAPQLQYIVDEWLKEHAKATVGDAAMKAAREQVNSLLEETKALMMKHAKKQLITTNRAIGYKKKIDIFKATLKDPNIGAKAKEKAKSKIKQYTNSLNGLKEQGIINKAGEIIKKRFDYQNWQERHGDKIRDKLQEIFTNVTEEIIIKGNIIPSLTDVLVDEVLSGRRIFANAPDAIAHYMISPEHFFTLMPEHEDYRKTIATFANIITVDVRAKGGRSVTSDGRLVTVGCKPSYRFDIRGKDIENAFLKVEELWANKNTQLQEQEESGEINIDEVSQTVDEAIDILGEQLSIMMTDALDVDRTVQSIVE